MPKKKIHYFMYLNALLSSFAVVVLHTIANPSSFKLNESRPSFYVIFCLVVGIIFSFGVPVFFMQSGANILNYRERYSTKTFFKKRIHKVVIPFFVWSVIGFFFIYGKMGNLLTIKSFIKGFLSGSLVGPYWFFYNIIGFYICVPFLSIIFTKNNCQIIKYFIIIAVIVNTILPIICIITKTQNMFGTTVPFIGAYAQYFLAGWFITNQSISKKNRKQIYAIALIMFVLEIIATIYFSFYYPRKIPQLNYPDGKIVKTFSDIAMFPAFCVMCGLFLSFKQLEPRLLKLKSKKYLKELAGLTFGIYLVHPFIITWLLVPFNQAICAFPLIIKMMFDPLFVYGVSGIFTFFVRKITWLRWLMP